MEDDKTGAEASGGGNNYCLVLPVVHKKAFFSWIFANYFVILHQKVRKSVVNIHKNELSNVNYENRKRNHQSVQSMERRS